MGIRLKIENFQSQVCVCAASANLTGAKSCADMGITMNRKYIIVKHEQKILSLLFEDNRLLHVNVERKQGSILGNVYVAKVKHVAKNIHAAFVEIAPGSTCFLNLERLKKPLLINRPYDGRILAEDEIIVQVYKEAAKTKPPVVNCSISLEGKYCVVSARKPGIAYSSKLSDKVKKRIGDALSEAHILEEYVKKQGIIIRTNARNLLLDSTDSYRENPQMFDNIENIPKEDSEAISGVLHYLIEEIRQLSQQLHQIMDIAPHRICYSLLYAPPVPYLAALRDEPEGLCGEIVTDEPEIYEEILAYRKANPAYRLPEVRLYQDDTLPLYKLYSVETRIQEALSKKVWLKSGGYLVIEPTEALTVIDVNTGKMIAGQDMEQTYLKINMEAAQEIALQLSLRNISGIIIVDFINMRPEEHNLKLMSFFGNLLKKDPVRTKLEGITALGLVEITRMKKERPLYELLHKGKKENVHETD